MAEKRLLKELKQLTKTPASTASHQILHLFPEDAEASLYKWKAVIAKPFKTDSPYYYNGQWELVISVGSSYPNKPPRIEFSKGTPIHHPNINLNTGEICLDILKDDAWSPAWNLQHLVGAILLLIDDPEPDSPLNVDSANLFRSDRTAFEAMVQYTMWQYSTFFEGKKEPTGLKLPPSLSMDITSEEEDSAGEISEGEDSGEEGETETGQLNTLQQPLATEALKHKLEKHEKESNSPLVEALQISKPTDNLPSKDQYIHDLGRQVTQEFLKKATEVESSSPEDLSKSPSSQLLAAVHQQVTNNVAKQIEEICSKGASNLLPPREKGTERTADVDKVKADFLEQIDRQVDEIRRNQEYQQSVVQ